MAVELVVIAFLVIAAAAVVVLALYRAGAALWSRNHKWHPVVQRVKGQGIAIGVQRGGNKRTFQTSKVIADTELVSDEVQALMDEAATFANKLNGLGVE